jgi:hypothetical protein
VFDNCFPVSTVCDYEVNVLWQFTSVLCQCPVSSEVLHICRFSRNRIVFFNGSTISTWIKLHLLEP